MSTSNEYWLEDRIHVALENRKEKGTYRRLTPNLAEIDFSSNDYLGLAHSIQQQEIVDSKYKEYISQMKGQATLGATGSRLLSGNNSVFESLEVYLAHIHKRPTALLCNSGYDANLSLISSLQCDVCLHDELIHNSLHMGLRLWQGHDPSTRRSLGFEHNNVNDLRKKLQFLADENVVILVESVYSMDGDIAPLRKMLDTAAEFNARVVVDEAHGLGIYGRHGAGILEHEDLERHPALFSSVHTFGKAAGCHGAVICGSQLMKDYLINYAYPFIYSTSLPLHSLITIQCAYETMTSEKGVQLRKKVFSLVDQFRLQLNRSLARLSDIKLLDSSSPIQALMIPGNELCTEFCQLIYERSNQRIRLYPIKSPTVPAGKERVRIVLHGHNSPEDVVNLVGLIETTLSEIGLLRPASRL